MVGEKDSHPGSGNKVLHFLNVHEVIVFLGIAILVFLIYSNTFHVPFIFDDEPNILNNHFIQVKSLTLESLKNAAFKSICHNRPVANISFALNYYLLQYNLPGYHLVNIIIHIITAILLYFFTKLTLEISRNKDSTPEGIKRQEPWLIALFTILVWAANPVQTQAITYIVQRMTSMASMFYILSMLMYVKGRMAETGKKKWAFFGLSILSGLLAMGSKEISATLPVVIFLYEWYFLQDLDKAWFKRKVIPLACVVALFAIVGLVYLGGHPIERILKGYETRNFTPPQRVLTEFRVVIFYISLFLFPHPSRLNLDHYISISHSLFDPITTLVSLIIILALIGLALYLAKKERIISFCILWFFGNLIIESSVIGLELVYEHRLYLPSMMLSLLLVLLAFRYIRPKWVAIAIITTFIAMGSVWSYQRNKVWQSEISIWQDCVKKSPEKARPYNNLGIILGEGGKQNEAIKYFLKAIEIDPNYGEPYNNIGFAMYKMGRIDEAIKYFSKALKVTPDVAKIHNNLGLALAKKGLLDKAIKHFSTAVQIDTLYGDAQNNFGLALYKIGKTDEAIKHLSKAIKMVPDLPEAYNNLGLALMKKGRLDEAIKQFQKALQINPGYTESRRNLELAVRLKKKVARIDHAISELKAQLESDPKNFVLYVKLGDLYRKKRDLDSALAQYKKALGIRPKSIAALNNLAMAYASEGNYEKALIQLEKIVELRPDNAAGYYNIACIYARQNKVDEAVSWLKKAIDKGFDNWELIRTDPDLRNIRGTEYYKELVQRHK